MSGDNPVFVESVKPGGAAQIAGLVAGDMILKVSTVERAQPEKYIVPKWWDKMFWDNVVKQCLENVAWWSNCLMLLGRFSKPLPKLSAFEFENNLWYIKLVV